jgi:hypothetical protein
MEALIWKLATPACAGTGFGVRYLWEKYSDNRRHRILDALEETKFRLEEFYCPILYCLMEDNHIWKHFLNDGQELSPDNMTNANLTDKQFRLFDNKNLKNMKKIHEIITKNIIKARPRGCMMKALNQFSEHATVYFVMREMDPDSKQFPSQLTPPAPFPRKFYEQVKERITDLMKEYNKLLSDLSYIR